MSLNCVGFDVTRAGDGIVRIRFNEPDRLNVMTQAMKRDLVEVLAQIQMDDDDRVVVFTGSGRAFSAGDDISVDHAFARGEPSLVTKLHPGHHEPLGTYNGLRVMSQALNLAVRNLDKPTIAAVNGVAVQVGFTLALCCDFRIVSSDARLGSGTLRYAMLPDEGCHWLLVHLLGLPKALDFLLRPRIITAAEALELGLVSEVVAPGELDVRVDELAAELARGPQTAQRLMKRLAYRAVDQTFEAACDDIAIRTAINDFDPDIEEGYAAFREKRTPRFD